MILARASLNVASIESKSTVSVVDTVVYSLKNGKYSDEYGDAYGEYGEEYGEYRDIMANIEMTIANMEMNMVIYYEHFVH